MISRSLISLSPESKLRLGMFFLLSNYEDYLQLLIICQDLWTADTIVSPRLSRIFFSGKAFFRAIRIRGRILIFACLFPSGTQNNSVICKNLVNHV